MVLATINPLGASTTNRSWRLEVDTGTTPGTPVWTPVRGRTDFQPALNPTLQDDSDMDSGGYKSQTVTAIDWSLAFKLARKTDGSATPAYDAGQEALRLASNQMGVANSVHVRWFETEAPKTEAYEGQAAVSWSPDGGGMDGLSTVSVTLTGQGQRKSITNPALP